MKNKPVNLILTLKQIDFQTPFGEVKSATKRFEVSAKFGYVNPEIPYQSLGLQMSYSDHDQTSYFGLNQYDIRHKSVYSNLVYNSIISDSRHKNKNRFERNL